MLFYCFQSPSLWSFGTGNRKLTHLPSTNPLAPWRKPPTQNSRGKWPACSRRWQGRPAPGPHYGWAGNRPQGVPKPQPQPGSGITSCPAFFPSKWGSSERSHSESREEKENVRLPVSHGFRHQQAWAIAPPCRMSPGHCGNAQLCHGPHPPTPPTPASRGWPGPAPNPKLLPEAQLEPTRREKVVWRVGSVGAAEGSPFFPNLFLADRDSLLCLGWVRQARSAAGAGAGQRLGGTPQCWEPGREPGLLGVWPECASSGDSRPSRASMMSTLESQHGV